MCEQNKNWIAKVPLEPQLEPAELHDSHDPHAVFADPIGYLGHLGLNVELVKLTHGGLAPAA